MEINRKAHLCVVGDDWQGINRFAGADIAVMTEFETTFEHATRRTLSTTFRSPQAICDASSTFVQANKAQIRKSVLTTNPISNNTILAYGFKHAESIPQAVEEQLGKLHQFVQDGRVAGRVSVMLLGRYRSDMPKGLRGWQNRFEQTMGIKFQTVHASKGTEAEYVFLLNVLEGSRGFPSQIGDDPVLQLAMPAPDPFPMAEERRLFYVALTRASKQVRIFTTLATPSRFLLELVKQGHLAIKPIDGELLESCPKCRQGVLFLRSGKFGQFHSCSTFPRCDFKRGQTGRAS